MNEQTPEHAPREPEGKPWRLQRGLLLALVASVISVASFVGVYLEGVTGDLSWAVVAAISASVGFIAIALARALDVLSVQRRQQKTIAERVTSTDLNEALQAVKDPDDYLNRISRQLRDGLVTRPEQLQAVNLLLHHLRLQAGRADEATAERLRAVANNGTLQLRYLQENKGQPYGVKEEAELQQSLEEIRQLLQEFPI
jgi:hypothetical protein